MYKIVCHCKKKSLEDYLNHYLSLSCSSDLNVIKSCFEFYSRLNPDCIFEIEEFQNNPIKLKEFFDSKISNTEVIKKVYAQ